MLSTLTFGLFGGSSNAASKLTVPEQGHSLSPGSQVISISHNADDDFVDVDLKRLSYAEVAALSRAVKISNYADGAKSNAIKIVEESELGTEISDCQMASALARCKAAGSPLDDAGVVVASPVAAEAATKAQRKGAGDALTEADEDSRAVEDEELLLDKLYYDKGNRFSSKQHRKKILEKKARRSL